MDYIFYTPEDRALLWEPQILKTCDFKTSSHLGCTYISLILWWRSCGAILYYWVKCIWDCIPLDYSSYKMNKESRLISTCCHPKTDETSKSNYWNSSIF
jgi:hypothetical protein